MNTILTPRSAFGKYIPDTTQEELVDKYNDKYLEYYQLSDFKAVNLQSPENTPAIINTDIRTSPSYHDIPYEILPIELIENPAVTPTYREREIFDGTDVDGNLRDILEKYAEDLVQDLLELSIFSNNCYEK
jgi:hypothetical protein